MTSFGLSSSADAMEPGLTLPTWHVPVDVSQEIRYPSGSVETTVMILNQTRHQSESTQSGPPLLTQTTNGLDFVD